MKNPIHCAGVVLLMAGVSLMPFYSSAQEKSAKDEVAKLPPTAKLQAYPTRIMLAPGETSAELNVINSGIATGRYRLSFQDMTMGEEGVLQAVPEGDEGPYSLKPYVRATPRSVTVPPGQSQKFRLLVRLPRDAAVGEYRTHAQILMSSDNAENEGAPKLDKNFAVQFKPRFRLAVPISIEVGDLTFSAGVESMQLLPVNAKNPARRGLDVWLTHSGNASSRGDIRITFDKAGESYELLKLRGYIIYPSTDRRRQEFTLDIPEGVSLSGGTIRFIYSKPESDGGDVIAEKELVI